MADGMISNGMYLVLFIILSIIQETWSTKCDTGFAGYSMYSYCSYGCCASTIRNNKCCSSGSSSIYYAYYTNIPYYGLSTGSVVGIVLSSLVGIGVLITLIICCACSKGKRGMVIRTGYPGIHHGGANVTVVSSNVVSGPTVAYNNGFQYSNQYRPPMGVQAYNTQPLQPMHQPMPPPSYSQVITHATPSVPPPAYYSNPVFTQPCAPTNVINVSPSTNSQM